jgi:hypothetical protein
MSPFDSIISSFFVVVALAGSLEFVVLLRQLFVAATPLSKVNGCALTYWSVWEACAVL